MYIKTENQKLKQTLHTPNILASLGYFGSILVIKNK